MACALEGHIRVEDSGSLSSHDVRLLSGDNTRVLTQNTIEMVVTIGAAIITSLRSTRTHNVRLGFYRHMQFNRIVAEAFNTICVGQDLQEACSLQNNLHALCIIPHPQSFCVFATALQLFKILLFLH